MHRAHDYLSKVTDQRKKCMPWEGTLDFWILLGITLMNLAAVGIGFYKLSVGTDVEGRPWEQPVFTTLTGCQSQNVQLIALVFAFIEATPGLLFIMYAPTSFIRLVFTNVTCCISWRCCDMLPNRQSNPIPSVANASRYSVDA